ncbi:unnamed protein product [Lactuca virosa]|uniref:Translation elongation factor EFG/EF2 domain-containing protein n=1 Tax=Lactuca virosa TaxID=75947 RepID=A0AAU9LTW6_9ASTR|nr:unnamed protein product [Lactuca virosa]
MGPQYIPGEKKDLFLKTVEKTVIWIGKTQEIDDEVPCGNIVALFGLDQSINKSVTLTNEKETEARPIRAMKFSAVQVVHVTVQSKVESDLPHLLDGLRLLAQSDSMVVWTGEESGEHIIGALGELHLETCLKDLQDDFMGGVEINVSGPFVSFGETVSNKYSRAVMSKSPNGHNNLYMRATPMDIRIADAIEVGRIDACDDPEVHGKIMCEEFDYDKNLVKKIWCFGPEGTGPNMVVDRCKGVEYLNEIKDFVVAGFQWVSEVGALAEENMRSICFEVCDAVVHADANHRGGAQVIPTARRVMYASQLSAEPRLVEPVYWVEIQAVPKEAISGIESVMKQKRGYESEKRLRPETRLYDMKAHLSVVESFGLSGDLKASASGQVFPQLQLQCIFSYWDTMDSDPLEDGS